MNERQEQRPQWMQFQEWAYANGYDDLRPSAPVPIGDGGYANVATNAAWKAWQAVHATMPDPLTIAYIAIGASEAWNEHDDLRRAFRGGQAELMDAVIKRAHTLDSLFDPEEGLGGSFYYEVAEPFGYQMAIARMKGEMLDAGELGHQLMAAVG